MLELVDDVLRRLDGDRLMLSSYVGMGEFQH